MHLAVVVVLLFGMDSFLHLMAQWSTSAGKRILGTLSAATGGFLQMRQGLGAASGSAMFGGVLLALIEGAGIMLNKVMSAPQNFPAMEEPLPNVPGVPGYPMGQIPGQAPADVESLGAGSLSSSSSSWLGGLFGGGKEEKGTGDES